MRVTSLILETSTQGHLDTQLRYNSCDLVPLTALAPGRVRDAASPQSRSRAAAGAGVKDQLCPKETSLRSFFFSFQ